MITTTRNSTICSTATSRAHRTGVALLLAIAAALAVTSLITDSITFDETNHLTAGMSYLKTGDFRLTPETPPLARVVAALPLLLMDHRWPDPQTTGWREGVIWPFARAWLFDLNDGERLVLPARGVMVGLFLLTCWCTYLLALRLFGSRAALLTLVLTALSPTFLAHGRLVTADMAATLSLTATLLTFTRLLERITWARMLAASLALAAASLVKFSWPLILPALVVMAMMTILRRTAITVAAPPDPRAWARADARSGYHSLYRMLGAMAVMVITTWLAIWSCYGWQFSPFRGDDRDRAMMASNPTPGGPIATTMDEAWKNILSDERGESMHGVTVGLIRWARSLRLLPEAYLYGLARGHKFAQNRPAYLMGEYSTTGWRSYFPITFAIKTPIATMIMILSGLIVVISNRFRQCQNHVLLAGVGTFIVTYSVVAVMSHYNVGHRHLLPIYPGLMVFAGASAAWLNTRWGRRLIGAALLWLIGVNLWIHPHYLSYFNELIGGPSRGHLFLADSNIDWGQDMKRLANYADGHPGETIKLAYFGSSDPSRYGFPCESLPSFLPFGEPAKLTPGIYVVSITQRLGVFNPSIRDSFWHGRTLFRYRQLKKASSEPIRENDPIELRRRKLSARAQFEQLRQVRLLNQLRHREPDERIGYSLFVYQLNEADIHELTEARRSNDSQ